MLSVEELSEMIVEELCEKKGFDNWWSSVEDEDQEVILEKLQDVISEWLEQDE